jgi:tetratricopeptide (TPR) repeat protein
MKRTAYLGLFVALFAALAAPGFAQQINDPVEYKAYFETVYSEKDAAKKAAAGEKFLKDYPTTVARTHTYNQIILAYYNSQNWAKALETADKQAQMAPTLAAEDKARTILIGMAAAEQAKNTPKLKEYAGKVLENDPKHAGALVTLSGILANSIPTDDATKAKHFDETLAITKRALAVPKPENATAEMWNPVRGQLYDTCAMVLLNQKKYAEAIAEAQEALKISKKDGYAYYLMGLAMKPAVADAIAKYTAAVDKLNLPENRTADQLVRDELKATADGLQSAAQAKTNELIDVFAKSVATGWANSASARNELKIFTGTPEELNKLIADKKVELGISAAD